MNASTGVRGHARVLDRRAARARLGAINAQCGWYSAPEATQRSPRVLVWAAVNGFLAEGGRGHHLLGGPPRGPRAIISEPSRVAGLEGPGGDGGLAACRAGGRPCGALSGPWQRKQVSRRIGRMSRLNSTSPANPAEARRPGRRPSRGALRPPGASVATIGRPCSRSGSSRLPLCVDRWKIGLVRAGRPDALRHGRGVAEALGGGDHDRRRVGGRIARGGEPPRGWGWVRPEGRSSVSVRPGIDQGRGVLTRNNTL